MIPRPPLLPAPSMSANRNWSQYSADALINSVRIIFFFSSFLLGFFVLFWKILLKRNVCDYSTDGRPFMENLRNNQSDQSAINSNGATPFIAAPQTFPKTQKIPPKIPTNSASNISVAALPDSTPERRHHHFFQLHLSGFCFHHFPPLFLFPFLLFLDLFLPPFWRFLRPKAAGKKDAGGKRSVPDLFRLAPTVRRVSLQQQHSHTHTHKNGIKSRKWRRRRRRRRRHLSFSISVSFSFPSVNDAGKPPFTWRAFVFWTHLSPEPSTGINRKGLAHRQGCPGNCLRRGNAGHRRGESGGGGGGGGGERGKKNSWFVLWFGKIEHEFTREMTFIMK